MNDSALNMNASSPAPKLILDVEFGETVESVADYYADALMNFQPRGPLILGGYWAGAVIALEMANELRARGRDVGSLFAIDGAPESQRSGKHAKNNDATLIEPL